MKRHSIFVVALFALSTFSGCGGEPQVAKANQKLISALRTAASARQVPWLDACAKQVEEGKSAGTMSAEEAAVFEEIIALARDGEWKQAEERAAALGAAQRPTAEDIERLKTPAGRKPKQ
jgi:hypothetical protein